MVFSTMGADPSRPLMMTINVSFIMTCFPQIVIQNGGKNALWERRETGQWHRVKNLLLSMTAYRFPHHDRRSFVRLKMTLSRQAYIFRLPPSSPRLIAFPSSQFILMTGSQRHEKTVAFHHCLFISYELILPCP